jgi:hypothetical protein
MKTIPVYDVIDWERIYNTWELPRGAKCQVHYVRQEKGKPDVEWDCVAVFQKMDWMYWLWCDEETWEPLIFNWKFKQVDQDCFCLLTNEKENESKLNNRLDLWE